jgi:hypothetical protein
MKRKSKGKNQKLKIKNVMTMARMVVGPQGSIFDF